ncbi:penicillin binding protein [Mycobacterium leprae Kyoto-2]|uniref:Penicillin-binding protein n=4 Tax=Mycobacterium leprae TaxID=1769 RepID=A0AAD0KSW1_MYCLR|nr:penicillin-binding protein [Mycobacterium leprae]OAR21605.1 penicillin-binding protein [Mycobacterium leprae 3125609]OAX71762.1 penicillin-binding protein [Mycobacterium leprae 7935681]CAR71672.1 probable penicillin binding protein [Mycobacterium leprae Br4923]BBC17255.1 penicillin binding protein [Mycobacterium leprae Kyoto-2]
MMVTRTSPGSFVSVVAGLCFVAVIAVSGCTPRPNGPGPAAAKFFDALAIGDTATAAQLSDNPNEAHEALNAAWAGLQAGRLDAQLISARYVEDTGTIAYRFTWHLPKNRTWSYDGQLKMVRYEGRWQVRWTATGLHPRLGEHQTFALRANPPRRASVNELGGSDVLVPGYLHHYALDATLAGSSLIGTARAVVEALHPFDDTLNDPQLLAEKASSVTEPLSLVTLRPDDNDRVASVIGRLPGVVVTLQADLLPTDSHFAPSVIAEVKKAVIDELDGQPGWRVVSVNRNGVDVAVLHEVEPSPASSVSITLDRFVQNAAQHAVDSRGGKAMIVVLKPSTGQILAIAQNAGANADGPLATTGLFPPGSTFKMVTAGAAIDRDMSTPNTMLGCPGRIDIGHRTILNYGGFDLGVVPMSRAFASSCNTTFAELSSRMPPRGLTQAANQYGIGLDYQVDGIATVTGSVPPTVDLAERTEDGFGQGRVLVSPFGMSLVAATVAAGKTPVPQLIVGRPTRVEGDSTPILPKVIDSLRPMMRLVVTNGTAKEIAGCCGAIFGKTGEAEFVGGSHSWFVGYRGDLAFAALIVGGGSSEYAVRMTKVMFESLPPDYLT